ncbi:vascular endothelial growth factor C-like isoform X2 [Homarus americanus]|nr:vascular endothelial growth factor C-like isoform X2 [Homarus americanus]
MGCTTLFLFTTLVVAIVAVNNTQQVHQDIERPVLAFQVQELQSPRFRLDYHLLHLIQSLLAERDSQFSQEDQGRPFSQEDQGRPFSQEDQRPLPSQEDQRHLFSSDEQHFQPSYDDQQFIQISQDDHHDHMHSFGQHSLNKELSPPSSPTRANNYFTQVSTIRRYNLSQLSFDAKERLKSVATVKELMELPGFPQLQEEEEEGGQLASYIDGSFRKSRRMHEQRRVTRKKEPHVVGTGCRVEHISVELKTQPGYRFVPACVKLGRCGGCCTPTKICTANTTRPVELKVIRVWENQTSVDDVKVEEEDVESCECKCVVVASDCDHSVMEYDENLCQCVCKRSLEDERKRCEASHHHLWHPVLCRCLCVGRHPDFNECSTGYEFSHANCSCVESP